ncbi:MAG TPA: hypothetical protein VM901_02945 [Bdellovibrionota bacterium]|nr:hypothetical protein [Bdellovibrionota bacterium]
MAAKPAVAQEETSVLPHGIFRTWAIFAAGGSEYKFNPQGKREGLAHMLNRSVSMLDLESTLQNSKDPQALNTSKQLKDLRTELNNFGSGVGSPKLGDNLFQSDLYADAQADVMQFVFALEYGLTPKLSVGLAAPLMWYDIQANFNTASQDSFHSVMHTVKGTPLESKVKQFAQQAPTSATFRKSIFTDQGYYEPSATKIFGLSDLEGGVKYRAFESTYVDSSLLFGFRLPTGTHKKDPRNLLDQSIGDGQLDLAFQASVDFKITPHLIFLSSAKYTFQTPDRELVVGKPKGSTAPLPDLTDLNSYDFANRKLGNIWEMNFNLRYYMFQHRVALISAYIFQNKFADSYSGDNPVLDYAALSRNTDTQTHATELFLIYSTVADYMRGQKAFPFEVSVTYHHTLAGRNAPDLNYGYARMKFFFN